MNVKRLCLLTLCIATIFQPATTLSFSFSDIGSNISGLASRSWAIAKSAFNKETLINAGKSCLRHVNKNKFGYAGLAFGATALILSFYVASSHEGQAEELQKIIEKLKTNVDHHDSLLTTKGHKTPIGIAKKTMAICRNRCEDLGKKIDTVNTTLTAKITSLETTPQTLNQLSQQLTAQQKQLEELTTKISTKKLNIVRSQKS